MSISVVDYLKHIRDEGRFLAKVTESISPDAFIEDEILKRACLSKSRVSLTEQPNATSNRLPPWTDSLWIDAVSRRSLTS